MKFADVIVDISHEKVDRPFQYLIPEKLKDEIVPGVSVMVPFGRGNKQIQGFVTDLSDETDYPIEKMKYIDSIKPQAASVESDNIKLAAWLKKYYGCTMIQALKTVLPVKQTMKQLEKKQITLLLSEEETKELLTICEKKHQTAKVRTLEALLEEPILPYELLSSKKHISAQTLNSLVKQGAIEITSQPYYRNPVRGVEMEEKRVQLSEEQKRIVDSVVGDFEKKDCIKKYLIHGITGSGKTEVYLELVSQMIKRGKQVIVMIPEIALTYQTVLRFYKRFGDRVSVMNSTLSAGEKYDQFRRAKEGDLDVIIGPRSALFTPFPNLGMIIIDEEHESSYKSESMPRFHARETAEEIASMHDASVVLGSATPSLTAYYRAKKGEYQLFEMTKRLTGGTLPFVHTVDLRAELKNGNRSIFSEKLQELMADRLQKKEQIMLFINRRGYAGFISCRSCGFVVKCPHCDVSLTEHRNGRMICHYCGYQAPKFPKCPECGSKYIMGFKAGTQQIEEEVHKYFPQAAVLRMDADTTQNKGEHEKILQAFSSGEADVLVGTQMIVKGHDFPNVTLVGVLAADLSLNLNDYTAAERTFQLLTQAAGRAGRGTKPGEVVIQTYQPEHYSVVHASAQDYLGFYEEEIAYRELLLYPPAAHMLEVIIQSKDEKKGMQLATNLADKAKSYVEDWPIKERGFIIGPAPASVGKVNDVYRLCVYIKNAEYDKLIEIKDQLEKEVHGWDSKTENVQYDFDPIRVM